MDDQEIIEKVLSYMESGKIHNEIEAERLLNAMARLKSSTPTGVSLTKEEKK